MKHPEKDRRIRKLINKWRNALLLGEWEISHVFEDRDGDETGGSRTVAEICVDYTYKNARITTFRNFWNYSHEEQDSIVCHELCHCHTQELWDFCIDFSNGRYHTPDDVWKAVETLTQRISIIAKRGHTGGKK